MEEDVPGSGSRRGEATLRSWGRNVRDGEEVADRIGEATAQVGGKERRGGDAQLMPEIITREEGQKDVLRVCPGHLQNFGILNESQTASIVVSLLFW